MNLLKRASSSLLGHIALIETLFSLPMFLYFLVQSYAEAELTVSWGIYLAVVWASFGVVGAALVWYSVSLPLIRRREGDRHSRPAQRGR
jgi:hypothetical protein